LQELGVSMVTHTFEMGADQVRPRFQILNQAGDCRTLLGLCSGNAPDEPLWLEPRQDEVLASTSALSLLPTKKFTIELPKAKHAATDFVVPLTYELNGSVSGIRTRLNSVLSEKVPEFMETLKKDPVVSIKYSDRFICSPWNTIILSGILGFFAKDTIESIEIRTLFKNPDARHPSYANHDWTRSEFLKTMLTIWMKEILGTRPDVILSTDKKDVPHDRNFELTLASGDQYICNFTHGMGHWTRDYSQRINFKFNLEAPTDTQCTAMMDICRTAKIKSSTNETTLISIYKSISQGTKAA